MPISPEQESTLIDTGFTKAQIANCTQDRIDALLTYATKTVVELQCTTSALMTCPVHNIDLLNFAAMRPSFFEKVSKDAATHDDLLLYGVIPFEQEMQNIAGSVASSLSRHF